jgi:Zn-dependent M28 family amino/carboxypeptidase
MHIYSDPQSHWLGSLAAEVMDLYTDIDTITAYENNPRPGSDHYSFAIRGYPAIFFIDAWFGNPDWYPYYHTTADTLGNLDMDLQASISQTGAALVAILARVDFENPDPIPTLSEWGLLILALTLLLAGTIGIIRRRKSVRIQSLI